jgi:hypothetical protein
MALEKSILHAFVTEDIPPAPRRRILAQGPWNVFSDEDMEKRLCEGHDYLGLHCGDVVSAETSRKYDSFLDAPNALAQKSSTQEPQFDWPVPVVAGHVAYCGGWPTTRQSGEKGRLTNKHVLQRLLDVEVFLRIRPRLNEGHLLAMDRPQR